jgi:hypothetical protein
MNQCTADIIPVKVYILLSQIQCIEFSLCWITGDREKVLAFDARYQHYESFEKYCNRIVMISINKEAPRRDNWCPKSVMILYDDKILAYTAAWYVGWCVHSFLDQVFYQCYNTVSYNIPLFAAGTKLVTLVSS